MEYKLTDIVGFIDASEFRNKKDPARLLNGRGGRVPGLEDINIDIFPPLIFAVLYRDYREEEIRLIEKQIHTCFPGQPLIIQDRSVRPAITLHKSQNVSEEMIISENGLKYFLHPLRGQNPGFFPDMRQGRKFVRKIVTELPGKTGMNPENKDCPKILNLFAYTCSFSVAALSAGAEKVVNIDMNRRSLDIGKRSHRLNHESIPGGYRNQALFLPHDIFKSFGRLKKEGPYDLIIADPPPSQKGSFMIGRDYPKLIRRLPEMLIPGGRILLTHNGPGSSWEEFENMAFSSLPGIKSANRIDPPEDFAPSEAGRGLKLIDIGL